MNIVHEPDRLKYNIAISAWIFQMDNIQSMLLCLAIFIGLFWYFTKTNNLPPGPFSWPIVGNAFTMLTSAFYGEQLHDLMTRMAKKYGKIFSFGLGGNERLILLSDATLIKKAFQKVEFSDRAPILPRLDELFKKGRGVLRASGDVWKHQRRFSLAIFRSFGVGKTSFDEDIAKEATLLCDAFRKSSGKPFDPRPDLMNASSNMICSITMGKRFNYDDQEFRQMLELLDARVQANGQGSIWFRFFIVRFLFQRSLRSLLNNLKMALGNIRQVIEEHKESMQERSEYECSNLIDLYLKEIGQTQDESLVNENHLVLFVNNLFAAGTETSSNTLAWCLLRLIAEPDMQQRIRDEIIATCGEDRLPMYSERSAMPFTEAFILEVHRLCTIAPLGLPHYAGKATTLHGYTIPQGSLILANIWAVHHDPEVWDNPEEFRPSRFLDENGQVVIKKEFMPFSIGRRICLGERLAKMEIFIFLTQLLSRFTFERADTSSPLTFKGRNGTTYGPCPYQLLATEIK